MNNSRHQYGLSLVELMIAITLSLLLIAGVLQIFLSSKQTYSNNNALSRVQESGRFAMEFLTQDIRNIGYKGQCLGTPLNHGITNALWRLDAPIQGWNNITNKPTHVVGTPIAGTDMLLVKLAAGGPGLATNRENTAGADTINLGASSSISKGAVTLISDAISCDLFINNALSNANSVAKNGAPAWTHDYTVETEVLPLQNATYYIRANVGRPPSLIRERLTVASEAPAWSPAEELVDGIEDMQILYGVAGPDKQVNDYVTANSVKDWNEVVSVRLHILAVSTETNVTPENQVIAFNGANITIADRRLAQVFTTTIGIRNRLP
jgi:type IV pilus assembly protein PilW